MFQAGFARVDITPPLGSPLAGYSTRRISDHILDPIELNCVAFSDGENTAVFITEDLLYVMENVATPLRDRIGKACGIPADHVFMQGLHQHTSLRIGTRPHVWGAGFDDKGYLDVLYRKFCDVANLAIRDLKDAVLLQAEAETPEPLSFVRRYRMKDGSVKTNPGFGNPEVDHPLDIPDNTVRLLRFVREEGEDIALVNFSCHPDVIGGTGFSADWPGFVRRYTEKALPNVKCILVNGAQGDTNHFNVFLPREEGLKRRGYKHADFMGKVISDTAVSLWDKATPMETGKVWGKCEMIYNKTNTRGIERMKECQQIRAEIARGERPQFKTATEIGENSRIAEIEKELIYQKIPVSVLCIGKAGFVGYGGEPFTRYATNAREVGAPLYIITACLTNGGQGYLPTKEAFDEGGYEAGSSRFTPTLEQETKDCAKRLLDEYKTL